MSSIPIKGYEGQYTINVRGEVVSSFSGLSLKHNLSTGYPRVGLYKPGSKAKYHTVHRLLAEHFIPNPLNLPLVNHINGDKSDSRIDNLEWVTASYNVKDGFNRGRIHPQQGKRHVDRTKTCKWCNNTYRYRKKRQMFCGIICSNAYNRSKIKLNRKRDDMGRYLTIALSEAGELNG